MILALLLACEPYPCWSTVRRLDPECPCVDVAYSFDGYAVCRADQAMDISADMVNCDCDGGGE